MEIQSLPVSTPEQIMRYYLSGGNIFFVDIHANLNNLDRVAALIDLVCRLQRDKSIFSVKSTRFEPRTIQISREAGQARFERSYRQEISERE